jgi:hypothetical protein
LHLNHGLRDLTASGSYVEDGLNEMKRFRLIRVSCLGVALSLLTGVLRLPAAPNPQTPRTLSTARVTIEVTGGDKDAPIENASVYLKYVEERKIAKDKQYELNVKTNRDGIAHVPDAPLGRVLIQIVAEGWKTYGRWYDITDAKQPIKIHLDRPPKWY